MKRFGSVLLMGVMVMSLAGCGGQSTKATTAAESVATAEAETESKADASEEAGKADAESGDSDAEKKVVKRELSQLVLIRIFLLWDL